MRKRVHQEADFWKVHTQSFDLLNAATNSKLKLFLDEGGKADVCMAIDEYGKDMKIVGYIERQQEEGISLEKAIKNAAIKYGKTEEYVKEVYEEAA